MIDEKGILQMVGLCRKAGKTVIGTEMVCEHLRAQSKKRGDRNNKNAGETDCIVLEGADTSENTHKKISDKCIYYNVKHIRLNSSCSALGKAVGKRATATVAIADASFCRAILSRLEEN